MNGSTSDKRSLEAPEDWTELQVILSNCLKHPDESLQDAITDGAISTELSEKMNAVGLDAPSDPPSVADRDLTEDYEALFGAFRQPFAPPAASPYKEWYVESKGGLMSGPSASRMEKRYDAIDADVPEAYPPDHVALQLEFASLLTEAEAFERLATFVEAELDWIDAFRNMVEGASAEAPFHRWCVERLVSVVRELRSALGVADPSEERIEQMTEQVRESVT